MASPSQDLLASPAPAVTAAAAAAVAEEVFGISGPVEPLGGERDHNFRIGGDRMVSLKIAHPAESVAALEMQQEALIHLKAADPVLPVPRVVPARNGSLVVSREVGGVMRPVRAVTYLPGVLLEGRGPNAALRRDLAVLLARLDRALAGFRHPAADRDYLWGPVQIMRLRPHAAHLAPERLSLVAENLDHLDAAVLPGLGGLRWQVIHSDVNPANLLVDPAAPDRVAGLIDFGDLIRAPLVFDPAIAAAYLGLVEEDPVATIAGFAGEYHAHLPLAPPELAVFGDLVRARLCQSLIVSAWRAGLHPVNREYILMHAEPVWAALQELSVRRKELVLAVRDSCGGPGD